MRKRLTKSEVLWLRTGRDMSRLVVCEVVREWSEKNQLTTGKFQSIQYISNTNPGQDWSPDF